MVELPTTKTVRTEPISSRTTILYGQPKVGKTEILSHLDDFLMIDLENGSNHLESSMVIKANNLKELSEVGKAIMKAGRPYKGVIIDTITELEDWCEQEATEKYMASPLGKKFNTKQGQLLPRDEWSSVLTLPNGAGYLWFRRSFNNWLRKLEKLADYVIFVAHVRDKFLGEEVETTVVPKELDLTGKNQRIAFKEADSIGFVYRTSKEPLELRISFKNHPDEFLAGSRVKHLKNQDFVLCKNNEDGSVEFHNWNKVFL